MGPAHGRVFVAHCKTMLKDYPKAPQARGPERRNLQQAVVGLWKVLTPSVERFSSGDVCHLVDVLVGLSTRDSVFRKELAVDDCIMMEAIRRRILKPKVMETLSGRQASRLI